jgi:protein O-mannosyl-transferase
MRHHRGVEQGAWILSRARSIPVAVAIVTFVAFIPALSADFVAWDDDRNFLGNPSYRGLGPAQLHWMWNTFHMGHYVPLTWMTLGLDYAIWGMNPTGYHLTNLLLHVANAVLLYFVARRLFVAGGLTSEAEGRASIDLAAVVAVLFFSIHPLRVESVAWVTERRDVLSELFFLLAILAYLRAVEREPRATTWYWSSVALFLCALLSKATSITLPLVLAILNVYPLRRMRDGWRSTTSRRVYLELLPYLVLSAIAVPITLAALTQPAQLGFAAKLAVSLYSLAFYLWKTIAPMNLAALYPMPQHVNPANILYIVSGAVAVALCAIAWMVRRRWPAVTAAWFAFLVIILPMLGAVQNGPQIAADRYTYHASPALALLAGVAATRGRASRRRRFGIIASVLLTLGALTWTQARVWRSSETLWAHDVRLEPESSIAQLSLANQLMNRGAFDAAAAHYAEAVRLDPSYAEGHNNFGVALARSGQTIQAIEQYRLAVALDPMNDEAHTNWGIALAQLGLVDQSLQQYQQAIAINPSSVAAETNWGNALVKLGRSSEAIDHYRVAVEIHPNDAGAHLNWGVALAQLHRYGEAAEHFRTVLRIDPSNADAQAYLDRAMQLSRDR